MNEQPATQGQPRLVLQGKSAPAQGNADLHPASPALMAQAMVGEGRLRSLEERKASPLWRRPEG